MFNSLGIRAKTLTVLISAIVFALLVAGILQYFYLYNYHKSYAFDKITLSQTVVKNELNFINSRNNTVIEDVLHDSRITASLAVFTNYQDKNNYNPIIFDEMKKGLLEHVVTKFALFNDICFTLFDVKGDVIAYMLSNNIIGLEQGIGTYKKGNLELINPYSKETIKFKYNPYSISQDFLGNDSTFDNYNIITREVENNKILCLVKVVKVYNNNQHVGYLKLTRHIDKSLLDDLSKKTSTSLDIYYENFNFDIVGDDFKNNIFNSIENLYDDGKNFIKSQEFLFDDEKIYIVNAISKDEFNAQLKNSVLIVFISIFVAIILVVPIMYILLDRDFLKPIYRLFEATKSIKRNNYDIDVNIKTTDVTINSFANSFKSMVEAIKQRDKEIKIRNFYDKLIASSSAKFIGWKSFDEQLFSTLRLIKMALKAQRVSLETFIEDSKIIKKDYKVGLDCKYASVCEDCLCLEKLFANNGREIIFVKDVSSDTTFEKCRIFKEQKIKSMVVIPIFHKDKRLAMLVIEFTKIKNVIDENYSYLLKPLASIFGNVINQELQDELNVSREQMLFQQSKMAAMGEMIGNIAHQWRQPLSAITTASSGMKLKQEYGMLTNEDIIDFNDSIITHANYLSKTIDDFRNFFKSSKELELFNVQKLVDNSVKLVESSYKHNYIDLVVDIKDDISLKGFLSEAIQALINILNNAKDAVVSNEPNQKVVMINVYLENDNIVISIQDSGGGIPDKIKEKIFEPYFTTKHQSQGTGIGLYMSNEIISKHLNGKITVENMKFNYNDSECFGANFKIYLPIHKDGE
ncbi:MAG: GAF domain-containing sensor histidine kinase [Arcobacteraceae bacterium]|jgi:signal transduction histidine kinase|nr:GAF domain-containing sensor histidine kinase [Arcobacteraceae bacterium]